MSIEKLVQIIHANDSSNWEARNREAFEGLFGGDGGRYRSAAQSDFMLRAPKIGPDDGVPYAAYIHPNNPKSGVYQGMSFVVCPVPDESCIFGLVIGTGGLNPDEGILSRPGHARKTKAIATWLNHQFGAGERIAWAKEDPTRIDIDTPGDLRQDWASCKKIFDRYGKVMYTLYRPTTDSRATAIALKALLDLFLSERGHEPMASDQKECQDLRAEWYRHLLPTTKDSNIAALLDNRKYVILQGPPGTGKTRMALSLIRDRYEGFGDTVQFHPNTTYENFIGGLSPQITSGELGLRFAPTPGTLMRAAQKAHENPARPYLLHIDEINRADVGKVLGEAIFLLEAKSDQARKVALPYDFGVPFGSNLQLPPNLHILGTMNTADRSIAMVDVAIRRRFAFVSLWPSQEVVEGHGCELTRKAFRRILSDFVEYASDESFPLMPGHSYFLEKDASKAAASLRVNLLPLLEEYLQQGYVRGFAEPIQSYLQWLRGL